MAIWHQWCVRLRRSTCVSRPVNLPCLPLPFFLLTLLACRCRSLWLRIVMVFSLCLCLCAFIFCALFFILPQDPHSDLVASVHAAAPAAASIATSQSFRNFDEDLPVPSININTPPMSVELPSSSPTAPHNETHPHMARSRLPPYVDRLFVVIYGAVIRMHVVTHPLQLACSFTHALTLIVCRPVFRAAGFPITGPLPTPAPAPAPAPTPTTMPTPFNPCRAVCFPVFRLHLHLHPRRPPLAPDVPVGWRMIMCMNDRVGCNGISPPVLSK